MDGWPGDSLSRDNAGSAASAATPQRSAFRTSQRQPGAPAQVPLAPSLERRRLQVYLTLLIVDAAVIVAAFLVAGYLYHGFWFESTVMLEIQLLVPFYWTAAIGNRAYEAGGALKPLTGSARAAVALLIAVGLLVFLTFYLKSSSQFSRAISSGGTFLGVVALALSRHQLRRFVVWRCGPTAANRLVLLDGGRHLELPHSFVIDAREHDLTPDLADPHALNRIGLFLRNMDQVIVCCPPERRRAWAMVLKSANIQSEIVDDDILELGAIGAHRDSHYASLVIATGPLRMTNRVLKRLLDVGMTIPAIVVLSPLLLLTALAIKLEDRGPVLFVQRRLGRGNCFFPIYKFRSMTLGQADHDGVLSTSRDDTRVTRVGRLIRAASIDELPQLINVLRGEMSLVGPRPHALSSYAGGKLFWEIDARYWHRHALKPGLTGLAQVRGFRGATPGEEDLTSRLQADLEYLVGWSIWRDLAIIFATLRVVVHRNAF